MSASSSSSSLVSRIGLLAAIASSSLAVAVAGCSCDDPPAQNDAGIPDTDGALDSDADLEDADVDGGPTECPPFEPFEEGDREGAADPLDIPAGQSRAGRLSEAMLPVDVTDLGVWAPGDFVMASSAGYALLIEDVGVSDLYDRYGGRPVGIARVDGGGLTDPGDFNEILFGLSTFFPGTTSVTVVSDGSDGEAAVIRISGPLAPIDFAGDVLDVLRGRNDFEGYPGAMEYRMEPGADHVEVTLIVQNPVVGAQWANRVLYGIFQGNRMPLLNPTSGFDTLTGTVSYAAFADLNERTSWALVAPEGHPVTSVADISGVTILGQERVRLGGCERLTIPLGSIALGTGVNGAQAAALRVLGTSLRTIHGTVFEADGTTPVPGVHVHASVGDAYFSRTTTAADGTYSLEVPEADIAVTAYRRGTAVSAPTTVAASAESGNISLPAAGYIDVTATIEGVAGPVRVQVLPTDGDVLAAPANYGEPKVTRGRIHVDFAPAGASALPVAPGTYDVIVSHGYEYSLHQQRVTVSAGGHVAVSADLVHQVDTTDWMCADYHLHTTRSPDADDDATVKILGMRADGLEIPVRSDHEFAADFQPIIERLGLTAWARGIPGEEMTTWVWGHFGVFPVVVDPSQRNGNIPNVYGVLPPAAFAEVRARPEDPLLIINHPRSSGPGFGYFNVAGYDPVTGTVAREDHWDDEFTVVEFFNDSSFRQNRERTVVDWFSFLNRGRRIFATGASDSHNIYGAPAGYPRTCLDLGTDDPTGLDPLAVRDATAAGHSYITGGIYLDVTAAGGAGPGSSVSGVGANTTIHVRVQAADWITAQELEVIVDGETVVTIPLDDDSDPIVRFDDDITVPVAASGSWMIVHVSSDEDMELLHPGREPFAVSNPIFFTR